MKDNLALYEAFRAVPPEAQKRIEGGRLKNMTDINPMWRIKKLTEQFGACGVGWKYVIKDKWIETCMAKDEITANLTIELYYKTETGEWSEPIPGIGGSMLVASESKGLYMNDECYKMALTDAISVACKALGIGADVYWQKDNTKYNDSNRQNEEQVKKPATYRDKVYAFAKEHGISLNEIAKDYGLNGSTTEERFKEVLSDLEGR